MTPTHAKANRAACLAVATALIGAGTYALAQTPESAHAGHAAMTDHGAIGVPGDHGIVVDFTLVDRDGKLVTDEDFRGRYVLLGFGFTHCEHICPLMALNMGRVVEGAASPATGIFVSVDTERDTAAASDDYARHFGESMLGLGGSVEQINAAAKNFKVSYAVTKTQDHYTVQHTANVYLIDPQGELVDVFVFSTGPDRIIEAID
ncbi:MAG TPA: SCO family protein [Gammaproteobacteria bacterium]|nr:SCO family protein [Gammaproteobacteria bacterium]